MKKQYSEEEIRQIVAEAKSRTDVCRLMGKPVNGTQITKVNLLIKQYNIDISHFLMGPDKQRIYPWIEKECPVCGDKFRTQHGHKREKTVCSVACSNTHFRSGTNNGNYIHGRSFKRNGSYVSEPEYRYICFQKWDKKCVICGWDKVVDVHHMDGDHSNNSVDNLIPLCPNHHTLTRMVEYKEEINRQIDEIVKSG